jgi:hypothetical protein
MHSGFAKQCPSFPDVQLHIGDAPLGAGPESITPDCGYGFRARSFHSRPGMTVVNDGISKCSM